MRSKISKELILQFLIVLVCLIILTLRFSDRTTHAQITCDGEPPNWSPPTSNVWVMGTEVSVIIFDTPDQNHFQTMSDAVREWNNYSITNCSGITFKKAERANRPYIENERVPDNIYLYC